VELEHPQRRENGRVRVAPLGKFRQTHCSIKVFFDIAHHHTQCRVAFDLLLVHRFKKILDIRVYESFEKLVSTAVENVKIRRRHLQLKVFEAVGSAIINAKHPILVSSNVKMFHSEHTNSMKLMIPDRSV